MEFSTDFFCTAKRIEAILTNYLLNAFATVFVTIDPIALAPVFLALTTGSSQRERMKIALQATIISSIILLGFLTTGAALLSFLGISLQAFQIAGGLLLLIISIEMIFEIRNKRKTRTAEKAALSGGDREIAIFPLAIPLIAGPAAISAVVLLSSSAPSQFEYIGLIGIVLFTLLLCFLSFLLAGVIDKILHSSIQLILTKLLGILLAALAVQFIGEGIYEFMNQLANQ